MSQAAIRAYQDLRSEILAGVHPAGQRLREEQLAATMGLSRTPIREALRRLQADGLVELAPHKGAHVVGWSEDDLEEIFELRVILEGQAARRAAQRNDLDISALRVLCDAMEAQLETLHDHAYDEITRLNMEFHRAIHRNGGRLLPDLLARVIEVPIVRRTFHEYTSTELHRSFAQHRELVEAIATGDSEWAQSVMHAHLRAGRAALRRIVGEHGMEGEPSA
ncbi:GntR family transcriptional regulator [Allosalinactinospora lopnorensis]|uniref:GntR family transcriptional regulator n=1 Tax=Allosalinactinospora lopnorensis TaxID=1352348 RepID=UPI000623BEB9|nr:GntR family transcriptional regulator [Allosalinactinospora lopnorensis]